MNSNQKEQNIRTLQKTIKWKKYSIVIIWTLDKIHLLPLFSWLFNYFMRLLKITKQMNPRLNYFYYAKIFTNAFRSSQTNKSTILFPFIMGSESTYNVREMMAAKYIENKGFNSQFLICDGIFEICSKERILKTRDKTPLFCSECYKNYNYIKKKTGLNIKFLSSLLQNVESAALNEDLSKVEKLTNIENCQKYTIENSIPIGNLAYKSVLRFFHKGELNNTQHEVDIYKEYIKSTIKTYYIFNLYLSTHPIHTVVLWNGTSFFDSTISFICKTKKIPYMTQESFIGSNSWIFKKNDVAIYLNYFNEWKRKASHLPLTPEEKGKVLTLFNQFKTGETNFVQFNDSQKGLNLDEKYEYVALFPNLNFDSYVLGRDPIFKSNDQWIIDTINYWNANVEGIKLIIRAHPAEIKLVTATTNFASEIVTPLLTDKIIFIDSPDDINSYEILKQVKYTLCYSSTIGVEALLNGIPTVVAGESFYKHFALVPKNKEDYFNIISALNGSTPKVDIDHDELLNFLHYLYFIRTKHVKGFDIDRKKGKILIKDTKNHQELISENKTILEDFHQDLISTDD